MNKMKYIKLDEYNSVDNVFIVFDQIINHADMANAFKSKYPGVEIVSAGFVIVNTDSDDSPTATCFGYSHTLKLESKPTDGSELTKQLV